MPLYEMHCDKCGKDFEIQVTIAEYSEGQFCRLCGASEVRQNFYVPAFRDTYSPMAPRRGRGAGIKSGKPRTSRSR
jgi:putative FmdB family regulatory protein